MLTVAILSTMYASAQNHAVGGRVLNENGSPIAGASIMVKGTTVGTSSNGSVNI